MRTWKSVTVATVAAGVVVGSAAWWHISQASSPPVREDVSALAAQLRCGAGDQIFRSVREIAVEEDAGPASPTAAVEAVLAQRYPNLDRANLRHSRSDGRRAEVSYSDAGARRAVFATRQVGDRWVVTAFAACNRTLLAGVAR